MIDVTVIGGGVMGLTTAWRLATAGRRVRLLERNPEAGQESSWAGAGIVPPRRIVPGLSPLELLQAHSVRLHTEWADELRHLTGVDNGYRRCGAVYPAFDDVQATALREEAAAWSRSGVDAEPLDLVGHGPASLRTIEPALDSSARASPIVAAMFLPDEAQLRNPRHLQALRIVCERSGVEIVTGAEVQSFRLAGDRLVEVVTPQGTFAAEQFALCGGAWTGDLAAKLGLRLAVRPIRGQIALLNPGRNVLQRIVNVGRRYLVPRDEGRVLVGSTEEDVGYDKQSTDAVIAELVEFAAQTVPALRDAPLEHRWAGLRPFSVDGLPYLGRAPGIANLYVAAGHYRWGITLSPATTVCLTQLLLGETPLLDLAPFRLDRPIA